MPVIPVNTVVEKKRINGKRSCHDIALQENRRFFRRKLAKIADFFAENSFHNIDP
jgi:hypothetical protein